MTEALRRSVKEAKRRLPPWSQVADEARERAADIEIGRTLFMEEYDVSSEAEYKRRAKQQGRIMTHAHIGLGSWAQTKSALLFLQDEMSRRGQVIDRFGLCLDRAMAYPPEMRDSIPRETGPRLSSLSEWVEAGQVVPIQPHAGDFMIGFPASMINTESALRAGITTIGNLSQYFAHEAPGWTDEIKTATETVKAIALMGHLADRGTLVHSYLDDGFGALFTDYATVVGWAYLETFIVEDLLAAKLAHCFGGVTSHPMMRMAWVMVMREVHGEDCLGSMWYGDTISSTEDFATNLGLCAEYLLWDMVAQLVCPTGHAVHPLPVTEAVRIPTAQEIAEVHVLAGQLKEAARRLKPHLDLTEAISIKEILVDSGKKVFTDTLSGLAALGVDIENPLELVYVLKKMGPAVLEREYGAGRRDASWPRGREPVQLTDMFAKTRRTSNDIVKHIRAVDWGEDVRVTLASTDVHEHALFIIHDGLKAMGLAPVLVGAEMSPAEVVGAAREGGARALVVATYNGSALRTGEALRSEMARLELSIPVFMGGRLNQASDEEELPVDVSDELAAIGIVPCQTIPELMREMSDRLAPGQG